ncbi:MAG: hypothetical protein ACI9XO_000680 [Paraglaciecola sp.]|jgi:hypothetical protein
MNKLLTFLLICLPFICFSQTENTRYFKGRIDDFNDINITLTCDQSDCEGQLKYLRSEVFFQLKGKLYGENLELKEINSLGNLSGRINGKCRNRNIDAQWTNFDRSISSRMVLEETLFADNLPTYCGENKWIMQYIHKNGDETIHLLMQTGANNQILGNADWNGKMYQIQGELNENDSFSARLKSSDGQIYTLKSNAYNPNRTLKATLTDVNKKSQNLTFKLREQLDVGCVRYADYTTAYDATYPKTKNKAFNSWIETIIFDWAKTCQNHVNSNKETVLKPENRAVHRATAWVDLSYLSKDFITGFIVFNNNWKNQPRCISFNFDLKKEISIIQKDLFKNIFDLPIFTKRVAANFFRNHPLYEDTDFKEWIEETKFPHFTIQRKGINFSTDFDLIYGQQNMLIPYIELAQFLQPNVLSGRDLD